MGCDVFINNAIGECLSQTHLLMELFEEWRHKNKHIINIGSRAAKVCEHRYRPHLYSVQKKALHAAIEQLQNCQRRCLVSNVSFGLVDTPANDMYENKQQMMSVNVAYKAIQLILNNAVEVSYIEIRNNPHVFLKDPT